jgi:hypothetical protein
MKRAVLISPASLPMGKCIATLLYSPCKGSREHYISEPGCRHLAPQRHAGDARAVEEALTRIMDSRVMDDVDPAGRAPGTQQTKSPHFGVKFRTIPVQV